MRPTWPGLLTVKGVHGADDPKYAYGGRNEGTTGDVTANTVTIDMANAADLVEEVYGGMASAEDNTGAVDHNTANMKNGTTHLLYGGYTFGKGAVTNNKVQFDGGTSTGYVAGGYLDNTDSTVEMTGNKVVFTNGTAAELAGADSNGKGKLRGNTVDFGGAASTAEILRGALAENEAAVEGNGVTMTAGTAESVYGSATYTTDPSNNLVGGNGRAEKNTVAITGGTIGTTMQAANVYGGKTTEGPGSGTTDNVVNLGAEDGTYAADLTNAQVHGDNSTDSAVNNNVLNVRGKDITVKSVDNFDKYNFKLKGNIGGGDTMLTLKNGGFGREIDWNNVSVDTRGQTGNPNGEVTLIKADTANALKFKNYDVRDLVNDPNADYEAILRTDTDKGAGSVHSATTVKLSTSRFRKSSWTYDGTNPVTNGEVAGGVSRRDGHTAEGNTLTIASTATTGLNAAYGGKAEAASDVRDNRVVVEGTGSGTITDAVGGATAKAGGVAEKNYVLIKGGMVTNAIGGFVSGANASATGNEVTVEGGTVTGQIVGGYTHELTSSSNGNTVTLGGGTFTGAEVWGTSYVNASNQASVLGSSDAQIAGNTLNVAAKDLEVKKVRNFEKYTFTPTNAVQNGDTMLTLSAAGGSVGGLVYGGKSYGTSAVKGNGVLMDGAAAPVDTLTGGYGASAESNRVELKDGTAHVAYGGNATTGDAIKNIVTITGGTVTDNIYGGQSRAGAASGNIVDIGAVHIQNGIADKAVVGGYAAVTDHNTVHLRGTEIDGIVLGGAIKDTASPLGIKANPDGKDNTLAIHAAGAKIADFAGVQNLHFYVPEERTAADTTPMLTLTANADKDIRGVKVGIGIAGDHSVLAKGDTISLLKSAAGKTLTTDAELKNETTGIQGFSMRYRFNLARQGDNELIATVSDTDLNPQTKSLVETRAASAALINSGADLLAGGGMNAAVNAADAGTGAGAQSTANDQTYHLRAAQSGSAVRLNTGSHVDAKGWNLNLGFARQKASERNTLTYGPFVEYGHGNYDSYLDDGTHGDGTASYIGAGVMAKAAAESGSYIEGSARVGRAKSDYTGDIAGRHAGYDMSSTYYAAHIGIGQEKKLGNGTIETYAKYFYTHQNGGSERLTSGDLYDFDDVDSHRLRVGARYTKQNGTGGSFYTGLAYEYEFDGDARASYAGYSTPTPTLKGGTGILELGYRFARPGSNVSYGLNLMGMTGKRRGITGGLQVNWAL